MNERQDVTRARLLDAAMTVVAEHGVSRATSRQIATAAGVNLQAITYHFGSKDDLVAQALVHAVRRWTQPVRDALTGLAEDPVGRLFTLTGMLLDALDAARDAIPAYLEAMAAASRQPELRDSVRALVDDLREDLATALHEMKEAGLLADWVDPEVMAALVVAAGDGFVLHAAVDPERFDPDVTLQQVIQLLLSASTLAVPQTNG
jgi:AcrR family transcriptional regulator